ncbi:flp pilus-assembly TadE/G-like family protein [Amycolatopsis sp. QT-25]|uniref:Rv3654c family TadE-like protein n=1 Tax=Amycolatopsis sp. QT-25 TaxID=3034022 RepID=UPI0023EC4CAA|nr:Rv3654c family TadE-like protein [Amycolatopsis sp. QT-25]WET79150.1 flp pilus-assembly TadE/G-like family protein [Amycolatopsis sp. QT-25]HET6286633.1 Rv3654c family TadE-like protein [Amycolatopsis sp.]
MTTDDRGVATAWTASIVAILIGAAVFAFWLGAAVTTRHRAEAAADLAALAAASHATDGPGAACERARQVTVRMSATLLTCRWERGDALVEVRSEPSGHLAAVGRAEARARAGPVDRPP